MSEWYDNQSAEVVLRPPRKLHTKPCLEKCLKLFTSREISWLLNIDVDTRDGDARALALGISIAQSKKIQARMVKWVKKCVAAAEEKDWNDEQS